MRRLRLVCRNPVLGSQFLAFRSQSLACSISTNARVTNPRLAATASPNRTCSNVAMSCGSTPASKMGVCLASSAHETPNVNNSVIDGLSLTSIDQYLMGLANTAELQQLISRFHVLAVWERSKKRISTIPRRSSIDVSYPIGHLLDCPTQSSGARRLRRVPCSDWLGDLSRHKFSKLIA